MSNMPSEMQTGEMEQTNVEAEKLGEWLSATQATEESDGPASACHVNRRLIPVKINCFSQFFVISAVFVYMNPMLAQSGLSASQLGLTALVTNGLVTCARLVSGPIMDRTKRKNLMIIILSLVTAAATLCFLGLPKERDYVMEGRIDEVGYFLAQLHQERKTAEHNFSSNNGWSLNVCWPIRAASCHTVDQFSDPANSSEFDLTAVSENQTGWNALYTIQNLETKAVRKQWWYAEPAVNNTILYCSKLVFGQQNDSQCVPIRNEHTKSAAYLTVMMGLILRAVVSCSHAPILNLLESITFDILGPSKSRFFGQTRLVGTLGFIVGALLMGVTINLFSKDSTKPFVRFSSIDPNDRSTFVNYMPSVIIGAGFSAFSAFTTSCIKQNSTRCKLKIHKAILVAFRSTEMAKCMLSCLLVGFILSLVGEYFTLVLTTEYGVSNTFLGLMLSGIVVTEVPMFFISGSLVSRFGPSLCVSAAFLVWSVYFAIISFVSNPWALLVAHSWSGFAFPLANNAILYQAATVGRDRSLNADGNLVASMQAITNAISCGLVPCFGGLFWGVLLDHLPGRYLFAVASCFSAAVIFLVPIVSLIIDKLCSK